MSLLKLASINFQKSAYYWGLLLFFSLTLAITGCDNQLKIKTYTQPCEEGIVNDQCSDSGIESPSLIVISDGSSYTNSSSMSLTLAPKGNPKYMYLTESDTCAPKDEDWIVFTSPYEWKLDGGDGEKTIRVKFQDEAGYSAEGCHGSTTITLDRQPPVASLNLTNTLADLQLGAIISVDVDDKEAKVTWSSETLTFEKVESQKHTVTVTATSGTSHKHKASVTAKDLAGNSVSIDFELTHLSSTSEVSNQTSTTTSSDSTTSSTLAVVIPASTPDSLTVTPSFEKLSLTWTSPDSDAMFILVRAAGSAPTAQPQDGTSYAVNDTLDGNSTIAYAGSSMTHDDLNLTNNTSYYYHLYAYDDNLKYSSAISGEGTPQYIWLKVESATEATCGIVQSGKLFCWGRYTLGNGTDGSTSQLTPEEVVSPPGFSGTWIDLTVADQHGCAIDSAHNAYCWGNNGSGALGDGLVSDGNIPVAVTDPVSGFSGSWSQLSAGDYYTCGLDTNGKGYCWGRADYGMLGNGGGVGNESDVIVPQAMATPVGFSGAWSQISNGHVHACGIDTNGKAYCWGHESNGALGDNSGSNQSTPVAVIDPAGFTAPWIQVTARVYFSCGIDSNNKAFCWGDDWHGPLGDGPGDTGQATAVAVDSTESFASLGLNGEGWYMCGLLLDGTAQCWGWNSNGEVGIDDNVYNDANSPTNVATTLKFSYITTGEYHTCGISTDTNVYCWGYNGSGQLGDNTTTSTYLPTKVINPQ